MGKFRFDYNKLYILAFFGMFFLLLFRDDVLGKYILFQIKMQIFPMSSEDSYVWEGVKLELLPTMGIKDDLFTLEGACYENEDDSGSSREVMYLAEDYYEQSFDDVIYGESMPEDMLDQENQENIATATEAQTDEITTSAPTTEAVMEASTTPVSSAISYSMEQLSDFEFLVSNCYLVDSSTSVNPDELNAENLLGMDMSIDLSGEDYKVLIYHTHGSEAFADSRPGVTEDTVIGVGDELAVLLESYGIKVYHDRNVYDTVNGVLDRSYAYDLSGDAVDEILAEYPSIEVVIDLHRDGVREDLKLVTDIDGRPTAQIMFVNGVSRLNVNGDIDYLYNPNKIANLGFSLQMYLQGKATYGDLMRRIYIRGYCFNLDRMPRAALVEVGAQTNTVQEAKNAMIPLADIIYKVLSGSE